MAKVESILCVYDSLFENVISDICEFNLEEKFITEDINFAFLRRNYAEHDDNFRQVIPYCIIKNGNKWGSYVRGVEGGEERLYETHSLGFGGHVAIEDCMISYKDLPRGTSVINTNFNIAHSLISGVEASVFRELYEELGIVVPVTIVKYSGKIIYTRNLFDRDCVSNFHLGLIYIMDITNTNIIKKIHTEDCIKNLSFYTIDELKDNISKYESWSQLIINYLVENNLEK